MASAHQFPKLLQQCLDKEIALGRILGPFMQPPIDNLVCSLVGMVAKKNSTKMRMITHLSYPTGNSIDHHIDPKDTTTSYQLFNYAVKIVARYGHGSYISKGDVEAAFRILPIAKKDWHFLGIKFNNRFYIDICLPFGASILCELIEKVGSVLQWLAHHRAGHPIACYLDNFFTAHILQ